MDERTNSEVKWVLGFGVGTEWVRYVCSCLVTDIIRLYLKCTTMIQAEKDMKKYVKETVTNSEKVILAEMWGMEAKWNQ